jgi:hypothetical protein
MRPTLVAIRTLNFGDHVFHHGDEIIPDLFDEQTVNRLIDQKRVKEYDTRDRRSLYRLFSPFSGCDQREQLTQEELDTLALPD